MLRKILQLNYLSSLQNAKLLVNPVYLRQLIHSRGIHSATRVFSYPQPVTVIKLQNSYFINFMYRSNNDTTHFRALHISARCLDELQQNRPSIAPRPNPAAATFAQKTLSEKDKLDCAVVPPIKLVKLPKKKPKTRNKKSKKNMKPSPETEGKIVKKKKLEVQVPRSLSAKFVDVLKHYYNGCKLLFFDIKVAARLTRKLMIGDILSRRERKQLVRTTADIFRLLPFMFFIVVPFMEFLLPLYLKFMPFMLPSTFKEENKEQEKLMIKLKAKLEITKFLKESLEETFKEASKKAKVVKSVEEFQDFMKNLRESHEIASTNDILKFSQLFEDELTLDSLERQQLRGLCQLLDLTPIGNSAMLRWRLRMRMRQLEADDRIIRHEGIDSMAVYEIQQACRERGMRAMGVSKKRLDQQLEQWLELHLDKKVPISLMLLSRILYHQKDLSIEGQILDTIKKLPDTAVEGVELKTAAISADRVDNRAKLERLRKEEEVLKQADLEVEQAATAEALAAAIIDRVDGELETEITGTMLAESIEAAIESSLSKTVLDEEEVDELKEEMSHQAMLMSEWGAGASREVTPEEEKYRLELYRAAHLLNKRVNRLISEMDVIIDKLHSERHDLHQDIAAREVRVASVNEKAARDSLHEQIKDRKERLVRISDITHAMQRIKSIPHDVRWERILQVMDEDRDGKLELDHVRRVVELLGTENVKLNSTELQRVMDMLEKEEAIEHAKEQALRESLRDTAKVLNLGDVRAETLDN